MDDVTERRAEARFTPDRRYTALAAGGVPIAVALAMLTDAAPGQLLASLAAVVLAAYVATDLLFSPRLLVTADGIVVNSPLLRARLAWSEVEDVRADVRQRLGLRATTLEIDAGATLAVLSRRAIGRDPEAAAALIAAFRPAR